MAGSIQDVRALGPLPQWGGDASAGPPDDPGDAGDAGPAERAAADARLQAFASNGPPADICDEFGAPNHDYDRCVKGNVSNPVLFQREGTDADAVDSRDIQQGSLGDCHVLAPLAALAGTPEGRALIRSAVVENKDDKGAVASYTVTLHAPEHHWFGKTTFRDVHVTVAGPYAVGHARERAQDLQNEIWPLVFEKAFAQYKGGYEKIGHGGVAVDAMTLLTGTEATYVSLSWPERWFGGYSADALHADLTHGKMVVLTTKAGIGGETGPEAMPADPQANADAHGLLSHHAYFVIGTEQRDGKLFLNLGNPWGEREPDAIPFDELTTWFAGVSVGAVPVKP